MVRGKSAFLSGGIAALALVLALSARPAAAQTYAWDPLGQGSTSGFSDGSGTWDTVTANWWSGTFPDTTWTSGNIAQFSSGTGGSTPYNVTLTPGGITAGGIIFQNQAYTISGSTLTLSGATPTIGVNATGGTISSVLAGTSGLAISGPGLLALTGNNIYTGPTMINNGTLALSGTIAGGSTIYVGNGVAGGGTFNVGQSTISNTLVLNGGIVSTGPYNAGSGGAITLSGSNLVHTFTATGASSLVVPFAETAQVLVVGGGGGGGAASDRTGGGGGGGGVLFSTLSLASSTYTLSVGAGGVGAVSGVAGGGNGGSSVLGTMTAFGGGFGADSNHKPAGTGSGTVSSGGGAYHNSSSTNGTGTTGQGNSGGSGFDSGSTAYWFAAGGGGGAGAVGTTATGSTAAGTSLSGNGGNGLAYNISGATVYYGGGGGGGMQDSGASYSWPGGTGGLGGGGAGGNNPNNGTTIAPVAGTNGLGGGGGGAGNTGNGAAGGSGVVIVSYPAYSIAIGQVTLSGPISVPVTSTLSALMGNNIVVDSAMSGPGGINVTSLVSPSGIVSYAVAQSYSGNTTISANSILQLGASNALPYGAGAGNISLGGTLDLDGQSTTNVNGLSGNGLVTSSAAGAAQLIVGNNGASSTFGGVFQNGSGTLGLTLAGPGTLLLTGNNTYTGGTSVNGGLLQIGTGISGNQGSAVLPSSGSVTVASGATIDFGMTSETNRTLLNSFNIAGSGSNGLGALAITNNGTTADVQIYRVALSGNATIGVWGTATNVNSGIHFGEGGTEAGSINLNGYTLTIAGSGATGGFAKLYNTNYITGSGSIQIASGGNLAVWSGSQSWTNTVAMNPGSTFSIASANSVAANLAVSGGTLYSLNGVGTLSGNVALAGTATLGNSYYGNTGTGLTLSGNISGAGGLIVTGGTNTLSGSNTFTGTTIINAGSVILANSAAGSSGSLWVTNGGVLSANVAGGGTINLSALSGASGTVNNILASTTSIFSVGALGTSTTYGGTFSNGSGTLGLAKIGAGSLTLTSAANSYTGATSVSGGTLAIVGAGSLGSNYAGAISNSGVLAFNTTTAQMLSGVISGNGALAGFGPGSLTLNGTNTYSGPTIISGGALIVNGALNPAGAVSISSATLSGTGSLGSTTVSSSSLISNTVAGTSLTLANLTLLDSTDAILAAPGPSTSSAAPIAVAGSVTTNGNYIPVTTTTFPSANSNYHLLSYGSGTPDPFSSLVFQPSRVLSLVDNTAASSIDLSASTTGAYPVWSGQGNGSWDYSSTGNWNLSGGGGPTTFMFADQVHFDDSVGTAGTTNVTINNGNVEPYSVTFANNLYAYTISGSNSIVGPGSLVMNGSGLVTISNLNTFYGGTTLNSGTVSVNSLSVGGTSSSALGTGLSLVFNGGRLVYTGPSTGGANVTNNATGNNYNISLLSGGGTLSTTSGYITLAGSLSGSGNLTFANPSYVLSDEEFFSTTTSNASQNFTGNITITNAAVQLRSAAANLLGNAASVIVGPNGSLSADAGSTSPSVLANPIVLNGGTLATQGVTMNYSGPVTVNPGTLNSVGWLNNGSSSPTLSGNLTGSGTVSTIGSGETVTLSGTNSGFTGSWLSTGIATTFTNPAAGSPNATWVANGQGFTANIAGGGTVSLGALVGNTGTVSNGLAGTTSTFAVGGLGGNTTFGGTLADGSGTTALTVTGGYFTLGSPQTYSGLTTVSAGTLQYPLNATNALNRAFVTNGALILSNTSNYFFSDSVSGTGSLTKIGGGALTLLTPLTYSGATTISSGSVALSPTTPAVSGFGGNGTGWVVNTSGSANYITNVIPITSNVLTLTDGHNTETRSAWETTKVSPINGFTANFVYNVNAGGTADGMAFVLQNAGTGSLGGGGGSFGYETNVTPSVAVILNLYNAVSQTLTGTDGTAFNTIGDSNANFFHTGLPINVAINYNPATQLLAWTMSNSTGSFGSSVTANLQSILGGSTAYVGFTGATGGVNSYQQISNFAYTPYGGGNNQLPSTTSLTLSGVLDLGGNNQTLGSLLGSGTVTSSVAAGVLLTAGGDNSSQVFSGLLQNGSGTLSIAKAGSGTWTLAGNNAFSGGTTISGGTLVLGNGGATGSLGSGGILNNAGLAFYRTDSALTISAPITGSGIVYQVGGGTTTLTGNNGYSGGTVISNGVLQVGAGGNSGTLGSGIIGVGGNGGLYFNRGDAALNVSSAISGAGAIYQAGTGSTTLSGPSPAFSGAINVNSGNLYLNALIGATSVSVANGATLGGTGSASSATVTVNDGGNLQAGQGGHGSLAVGALNFNTASIGDNVSILNFTNYTSSAAINATGGLSANGINSNSVSINLVGTAPTNTTTNVAQLIQYSGPSIGGNLGVSAFSLNPTGLIGYNVIRDSFNLVTSTPGYISVAYSVDYPIWTGALNGVWDSNPQSSPFNWKSAQTGSPTDFINYFDSVVFDDSAGSNNTTVSLNGGGNVDPSSVTFNNNRLSYVITGSNSIEGSTPVTISGSGTVTILNANTYGGGTILNAGRLNIANSAALGSAMNYLANNATLAVNGGTIDNTSGGPLTTDNYPISWNSRFTFGGSGPLTFGSSANGVAGTVALGTSASVFLPNSTPLTFYGPLTGNGVGFTQNGAGLLALLGSNTYTGPTIVNGGTLSIGNGGGGASIGTTSGVAVAAGAVLLFNHSDAVTFPATISGSGSMVQSGGLLNLTNSNTYTGGTTVASGALELSFGGPAGTLAPNSTVTVNSGASLLFGVSNALGTSASSTALTVNSGGQAFAFGGVRVPLWNTVTLTGGSLTSAGGNGDGNGNYSLSGQVNATSDAFGNPAAIAATQVSLLNSTVLNVTRGSATPPADLVVSSVISSLPSGNGIILLGSGITQFTGANTYNGGTTLVGGTLQVGNNSALGASTGSLIVLGNATLDVNGLSPTVGALNGSGIVDNISAGGTPTLTVGGGGASGGFFGTIQNTTGALALAKIGSGTQVLAGTNTYTGGTQVNGGILNFTASALPVSNISFGGGTLQWAAGNTADVSAGIVPIPVGITAGIDTIGNNVTFASSLSGGGGLAKAGSGTLSLTAPNAFSGQTSVTGGTLNVAHAMALQNSTLNVSTNNSVAFSVPAATLGGLSGSGSLNLGPTALTVGANNISTGYSGALSGGSGLTKVGTGTLTLTSPNTYSGATNISGGVLRISSVPTSLPVTAGLDYWLDASNPLSVNTGTAVSSWNDLSGNGINFTNHSAVPPTLAVGAMNGLPMLQFDGSSQSLNYSGTLSAQTVIIVNNPSTAGNSLGGIWGNYGNDNGIRLANTGGGEISGTWRGWPNSAGDTTDQNDFAGETAGGSGVPLPNANTFISTPGSFDANTTSFGSLGTPQVLTVNGSATYTNTGIGNYYDGLTGGRYYGGEIGEVIVYNTLLTTAQRQAVEAYLMNKWFNVVEPGYGSVSVLPSTTPVTISNGGTFDMTNGTQTIASLSSTDGNGSTVLLGAGVLTVGDSTSTTFDGTITGAGGSLVKQGAGTLLLTGTLAGGIPTSNSSFSGNVTINGGTLVGAALSTGGNSVFGAQSNARTIAVNVGATLQLDARNMFGPAFNSTTAPTLIVNGGVVTNADPAGSGAINNAINNIVLNGGTLTATTGQHGGYAAWNINGTITSSGTSVISTSDPVYGTDMLSSVGNHISTIDVVSGELIISAPLVQDNVDSVVSGLSLTGSGTLILSGSNDYTGGTFVTSGDLITASPGALPTGTSLYVGQSASSLFAPAVAGPAVSAGQGIAAVPEPGTLALFLAGVCGAVVYRRLRSRKANER